MNRYLLKDFITDYEVESKFKEVHLIIDGRLGKMPLSAYKATKPEILNYEVRDWSHGSESIAIIIGSDVEN